MIKRTATLLKQGLEEVYEHSDAQSEILSNKKYYQGQSQLSFSQRCGSSDNSRSFGKKKRSPKAKSKTSAAGEFQMFKPPYLEDEAEETVTPSDARTAKRDKNRDHGKRQHQSSSTSKSKESSSHQVGVLKKFLPPYHMSDDDPEP